MPSKALQPCRRCGILGCRQHLVKAWHVMPTTTPRLRGAKLQQARAQLFAKQPFCEICKVRIATIRDHIIPLAEGGAENTVNTQALCQFCSDAKTQQEAQRGRRRHG